MIKKIKNVALLVGGWSAERDVSLNKGQAVEKALKESDYAVTIIDVTQDLDQLLTALTPRPDAIFNNLHGKGGEDGIIQGVLEMLQIPYTHSGVLASAIGMNKEASKSVAATHGIAIAETLTAPFQPPYVVKPVDQGSSVDVTIVLEGDNFEPDLSKNDFMIERYIAGRELTCAVLDGKAQAVSEIISATRFFDYEAKYKDTRTKTLLPAPIPEDIYAKTMQWSETLFKALGCHGLARCDYRYDENDAGLVFLEINTQPGCTPESIGPSQVVYNGMDFNALCSYLVETATLKKR